MIKVVFLDLIYILYVLKFQYALYFSFFPCFYGLREMEFSL